MRKIYTEEGVAGLAKGVYPSMWREVTYSSVRFGAYEPIRQILSKASGPTGGERSTHMKQDPHMTSPFIKYISGLLSGGTGAAICNPLDVVKTRFQALLPGESLPYSGTFSALRGIYAIEGIEGLYRGWMVTTARAGVLSSAQIGSYDTIKHNILIRYFGLSEGFLLHMIAAMTAAIITTTAINPCKSTMPFL